MLPRSPFRNRITRMTLRHRYYLDQHQDRLRVSVEDQVDERAQLAGKPLETVAYPQMPSVLINNFARPHNASCQGDSLIFNPTILAALGDLAPRLLMAPYVSHTVPHLLRAPLLFATVSVVERFSRCFAYRAPATKHLEDQPPSLQPHAQMFHQVFARS